MVCAVCVGEAVFSPRQAKAQPQKWFFDKKCSSIPWQFPYAKEYNANGSQNT